MPRVRDLPRQLAGLARRNAMTMRHESFPYDAERLVTAIERVLAARTPAGTEVAQDPQVVKAFRLGREVTGVAFGPDGHLLATASADQTARIWDTTTGEERIRFHHDDGVTAAERHGAGPFVDRRSDRGERRGTAGRHRHPGVPGRAR